MIQIEITTRCNAMCQYCVKTFYKEDEENMRFSTFRQIVDWVCLRSQKENWLLQGTGEPLLHKDINKMIAYIRQCDPQSNISIISNGTLLTERILHELIQSGLTQITLSMDNINEDFEKIRKGVSWNQFVNTCQIIHKYNLSNDSKIKFGFSTVAMRTNLDNLYDIISFGVQYGIDHISIMPLVIINQGISISNNSMFKIDQDKLQQTFCSLQDQGKKWGIDVSVPLLRMRDKLDILSRKNKLVCSRISGFYFDVKGFSAPCCMLAGDKTWGKIGLLSEEKFYQFKKAWANSGAIPFYCEKCVISSGIIL